MTSHNSIILHCVLTMLIAEYKVYCKLKHIILHEICYCAYTFNVVCDTPKINVDLIGVCHVDQPVIFDY